MKNNYIVYPIEKLDELEWQGQVQSTVNKINAHSDLINKGANKDMEKKINVAVQKGIEASEKRMAANTEASEKRILASNQKLEDLILLLTKKATTTIEIGDADKKIAKDNIAEKTLIDSSAKNLDDDDADLIGDKKAE